LPRRSEALSFPHFPRGERPCGDRHYRLYVRL